MKRLSTVIKILVLCGLTLCASARASAAALTGTLDRTITLPQSPVVSNASGVAIALDDSVAYLCDQVGNQILKLTLSGSYTVTVWATGLTLPRDCALSADGATLYVLLDSGALYSINTSTAAATQIGTINGNGDTSTWRHFSLSADGASLYVINDSDKYIWRYTLSGGTLSQVAGTANRFTSGLFATPDGQYLYFFASNNGPGTQGPLFRMVLTQGRIEVAAGNGVNTDANGEAFLVASISSSGDVVTNPTGTNVYFSSGNKLKMLTGGTVSQLSSSNWTTSGGKLAYFHLSDRIISTVGNTVYVIS